MYLHGNLMSILLAVLSCAVIVRARRVAPLIEEDWAKRPHRAAEINKAKWTWYSRKNHRKVRKMEKGGTPVAGREALTSSQSADMRYKGEEDGESIKEKRQESP
ncbi:hypothetical protein WN51_10672 [Melipona quadrifasciata]|uniref:Secreted protein n=1 Tax=Melipona quadrifasciata TaxID=166423 RepID=A0A0M9ABY6_9HYME|nr:hypothetical protein WN51_10672 [Melipona quadrifasciata]